jgi:hypothetical protein
MKPPHQDRKEKHRARHHGLTQQKRQEIKEAFELFDTDGSGIAICCYHICLWYSYLIYVLINFLFAFLFRHY